MESNIWLIRHGITEGLEKNVFYGRLDYHITDKGFKELEVFKNSGIYPDLTDDNCEFYVSGLTRTKETLKAIYGDVKYGVIPNLMELNFGEWEGKAYMDLQNQKKWTEWMEDTTGDFRFPGGESTSEFNSRVYEGYLELLENHKKSAFKDTVMVFHGGVTATLMERLFPNEGLYFNEWCPKAGRGYRLKYDNYILKGYERI